MSRSPRRTAHRWRAPLGRQGRARRRRTRIGIAVVIILPVLIVVLLNRPRLPELFRSSASTTYDERTILDSLRATDERRDWASALLWVERLGRIRPRDDVVLRSRGTAWSNYAVDQRPGRVFPRPALRTSLERMECLRRAAGLMDSSARIAVEPTQWLDSRERLARLYENLGLPGDALIAYETVTERLPDEINPATRARRLRALFHDPVDPDTNASQGRIKGLGRR